MSYRKQDSEAQQSRIERLVGDLETFDLILDRVLWNWGGKGKIIPLDHPRNLFQDPSSFSPLCKQVRDIEGGDELCWNHDLRVAKAVSTTGKSIESICDCGLVGVTTPILVNGQVIAVILFGQRRVSDDPDFTIEAMKKLRRAEKSLGIEPNSLQNSWNEVKAVTRAEVEEAKADVERIAKFIADIVVEREELQIRSNRSTKLEVELDKLSLTNLSKAKPIKDFWRVLRDIFPKICSILDAQAGLLLRACPSTKETFIIETRYPSTNGQQRASYSITESQWQKLVQDGVACIATEEFDRRYELHGLFEESELSHPQKTEVAVVPVQIDSLQDTRIVFVLANKPALAPIELVARLPFCRQINLFETLASRLKLSYNGVLRYYGELFLEETRKQYIQDISHQLVGPLSGLRAHCENLLRGRVSVQRGRVILETLVEQAGLLQRYAENFGLAARSGRSIFDPSEWDPKLYDSKHLVDILVKCTKSFQGQAKARDLRGPSVDEVSFRGFPPLRLDTELFEILVLNLCDNAVKYSYESAPITIAGRVLDGKVEIEFTNHGIPLEPQEVEMIFQRYTRSQAAEGFAPVGTGIGLFICDQIVKLHKGSIRALPSKRSLYGNEVKFIITLPVAKTISPVRR